MRKALRTSLAVLGLLVVIVTVGFVAWGTTPAQPMPEALEALQPDARVDITINEWFVFKPLTTQPNTGLILYPGGRVDPRAYAPMARQIAGQGYLVVIVRMPLNLAVFNPNAAEKVIFAYPEIQHWAVGGHSLGGAMAANYASQHPGAVQGLVLWAAYPASSDDLSASGLHVVSIFGSLDGLATGEKIDASRPLLPADTTWVSIGGGNHAQFGWYGNQAGDNPALISRIEQQAKVLDATLELLMSLK